ncbi:MAG: hypothetical protein K6V36_13305, partial [Anaerolineae bacterium]|nr:hypothetical protein [Anaerolineae bacterium]
MSQTETSTPHDLQLEFRPRIASVAWLSLTVLAILLEFATEACRWPWEVQLVAVCLAVFSLGAWACLSRSALLASWLLVLGSLVVTLLAVWWRPQAHILC